MASHHTNNSFNLKINVVKLTGLVTKTLWAIEKIWFKRKRFISIKLDSIYNVPNSALTLVTS